MKRCFSAASALLLFALCQPGAAGARARLVSVVPVDDGCVGAPAGSKDETWAVQPGGTYTVRIDRVTEYGSGGLDRFLDMILAGTSRGDIPIVATRVAMGSYEFVYTVPEGACDAPHIRYGVTRGVTDSGLEVGRHDDGTWRSRLNASSFSAGCSNPRPIGCTGATPTISSTWGTLKSSYR